jgi:choline kinase
LESDLLYAPKAISLLLNSDFEDCILVAKLTGSGDEVYICVDDKQRVIELGKNIANQNKKNAIGELVGISRFSREFLSKLFKKAEENYKEGKLNYHYEECVFETTKFDRPVYAIIDKDLAWIEIDNENDLKKAKEQIYPRIKGEQKNDRD